MKGNKMNITQEVDIDLDDYIEEIKEYYDLVENGKYCDSLIEEILEVLPEGKLKTAIEYKLKGIHASTPLRSLI